MQDEEGPVSAENQMEGAMNVFETSLRHLAKKMEALKADTLATFNEVHETADMAGQRNAAVRDVNARFRAFLGVSNNPPRRVAQEIEAKPNETPETTE